MKFIEPLVLGFKAVVTAPFQRSEEFKLLSSALDNVAQGDKPWLMERIVESLPKHMSAYERMRLRKMAAAHAKLIEARLYRQALCRFSLGEELDLEREAMNARALGRYEYEKQEQRQTFVGAQQAAGNIQAAMSNYQSQMAAIRQSYNTQNQMYGSLTQEQIETAYRQAKQ